MKKILKNTVVRIRQCLEEGCPNAPIFLAEDLASVTAARIPDEYRNLSRFFPVVVLVPKSAAHDGVQGRPPIPNQANPRPERLPDRSSQPETGMTRFRNQSSCDNLTFGEVTICFSTMEVHRRGQSVVLTCKEFNTLAYLIKNARKVISRDELLNIVWGYHNYPCTRTVDNHILRLRAKLEPLPAHPRHFITVHGAGYKFLP
jgi:Transcriptional regulatory protein, C terminal